MPMKRRGTQSPSVLGLPPDASRAEAEAARDRLAEFLAGAPEELRGWAASQLAAADESLASWTCPAAAEADDDGGTYIDVARLDSAERPVRNSPKAPAARRIRLVPILMALLIPAIVVGVYLMGGTPAPAAAPHPSVQAMPTPTTPTLDAARVAELTAAVEKNPKDADSLRALGLEYFKAQQFSDAATWLGKVVELKPKDMDARLTTGVALFNSGDLKGAEKHWLAGVDIDPKSPDPYYNLGFLYMGTNPPDLAKVEANWKKVIELAPDSDLAKNAAAHLQRLKSTTSSPSATPTGGK